MTYPTPKKLLFVGLYAVAILLLLTIGANLYNDRHKRLKASQPNAPVAQSAQELLTNFYTNYNKVPADRSKLVKSYTTAQFQKKYFTSKNLDLVTCGNQPTPTLTITKAYVDKSNNTVFNIIFQYPDVGSQNSVVVKVANLGHSNYQINDVICPSEVDIIKR